METALAGRKILVTGASGFIGRRLVAALLGAGAAVTTLSRGRAAPRPGLTAISGALGDPGALGRALAGQEIVMNLAYDVRAPAAANLAAFDGLIAAAGDRRIVHASSIVVNDDWPGGDCSEAGRTDRTGGGPYRQAKIAMERRLMERPGPTAILRPTIVYGPGSALWTDGFAMALLAGGVVLPEPEGLCNGVFVDDVVQAFMKAAALPDLGRERFIVSGPAPFAWSALIEGYAAILGQGRLIRLPHDEIAARLGPPPAEDGGAPPVAARISAGARRLIGHDRFEALLRSLRRHARKDAVLWPDHHHLAEYSGRGICRIDHARARIGYAPDYDLAQGLAATADYLRGLKT